MNIREVDNEHLRLIAKDLSYLKDHGHWKHGVPNWIHKMFPNGNIDDIERAKEVAKAEIVRRYAIGI